MGALDPADAIDFDVCRWQRAAGACRPTAISPLAQQPAEAAEAGANVRGSAGLEFGYHVTGGDFSMKYPAVGSLNVQTTAGDTAVAVGRPFRLTSGFEPGVRSFTVPNAVSLTATGGFGYDESSTGLSFESFSRPEFATRFPGAAAWAGLHYDVSAGAYVQANVLFKSFRKRFNFGEAGYVPLLEANPSGVSIAGIGRGALFDRDIPIAGFGNVRLSYPDVSVRAAGVRPDDSLRGFAAKPILQLNGNLEKLVPLAGPFLSNSIGPIGYTLLGVEAGPTLNLYQEFTFTPDPHVRLAFSEPILHRGADGRFRPTSVVEFRLGDELDLRPSISPGDEIRIQPTYLLRNQLSNETGLSLGAAGKFDVLSLDTPFGSVGPVFSERFSVSDLARISLYDRTFEIPLKPIVGKAFTLQKAGFLELALRNYGLVLGAAEPMGFDADGTSRFLVELFINDAEGTTLSEYTLELGGTLLEYRTPDFDDIVQGVLETPDDVWLDTDDLGLGRVNLGRHFSVNSVDASLFFEETNPSFGFDDDELFIARLDEYEDGLAGIFDDPFLVGTNVTSVVRAYETEVFETEEIPEPAGAVLITFAAAGMIRRTRRRPAR